jgi:hypothetical protein
MPRNVPPTPRPFALLLPALLLGYPQIAESRTIEVPSEYQTIQAAIDSATHGDEIVVATGMYVENIFVNGLNLIIRSIDPINPSIVQSTILQSSISSIGQRENSAVVVFAGNESADCQLVGFTITGGKNTTVGKAGGILGNHTLATISRNRLIGNEGGVVAECDGIVSYPGLFTRP